MGQRRLVTPQGDNPEKRQNQPNQKRKTDTTVMANTNTRRGEVQRAQRRMSENVNVRASQHVINVPVNKSIYNGYEGRQFTMLDMKKQRPSTRPSLKVIPIGGVGEMGIGKNMTALQYDNDIIIVDMGFLFPGPDYPGINYITPDISWLVERKDQIRGVVFTHAHLDHIGAFRHLIPQLQIPVYATKFTIGMLQKNMEEATDDYEPQYIEINPEAHERVQVGDSFNIELIRVNHSIPDAAAVVIRTPVGNVLSSGDWRIEDTPVDGKAFDFSRLSEIQQKEGFMLFMNESTDCESEGSSTVHSEQDVAHNIGEVMDMFHGSRMIVSCFSSNLHRMQLILEEAKLHDRKVAFAGYSMLQNLEVALRAGSIKVPKDVVMKMEDITKLPDSKVTIVCTGSQGEFNAVLNRMATGAHKHVKIKPSDVIVFSSSMIPGNDKYIIHTVDGLMREGSEVLQDRRVNLKGIGRLHLTGHAYHDDHVRLIGVVNPTFYLPNHGEFHMLVHNAELAEKECNIPRSNIFVCDAGDIVEFYHDGTAKKSGRIPVGGIMYDDSGAEVSEVVLKDRIHMANEGIFVVVLTVSKSSGRLLTSPDIISRGFIYLRDSEELMNLIRQYLKQKVARLFSGRKLDMDAAKKELRDELTHLLYDQTHRTPIVIPVINEIGGGSTPPQTSNGNRLGQPPRPQGPKPPFVPKTDWSQPVPADAEVPHLAGRSPRDI
ncbi:MAG: ribonuclease J [Candidatus Saccharimonadales bacterium]|jgi:ribonuclease J